MAEVFGVMCTVNQAGAASDGAEGPEPVIYLNLTDSAGTFAGAWFYGGIGQKGDASGCARSDKWAEKGKCYYPGVPAARAQKFTLSDRLNGTLE